MQPKVKVHADKEDNSDKKEALLSQKIDEVKEEAKVIEANAGEEDGIVDHMSKQLDDKEEIMTLKDLCKISSCDIKVKKQKDLIYDSVCRCIGIVLNAPEYRNQLSQSREKLSKKILDIFKTANFRKEVTTVLSLYLNRTAGLPNYVSILATDQCMSIKYSRGSLMQIVIAKTFNLTLF